MNNTFITYIEPLLNDINHPELIQEWKLNIDATAYGKKIDADVYKPSSKKEIYCHDSNSYWSTLINDTIQWFSFLYIIDHTANIFEPNKGLITSLLKVFAMLQLHLFYDKHIEENNIVDAIVIRCSKFNKAVAKSVNEM